MKEKLLCQPFP